MRENRFRNTATYKSGIVWMLCCLYLIFSVGIVKATHFCMGREASVSYFTAEAEKCPCSLFSAEKDDCCNDEHELLKLEDTQKNLSSFIITTPSFVYLGDIFSPDISFYGDNAIQQYSLGTADPQPLPKSLFKFHCSYVFYDNNSLV